MRSLRVVFPESMWALIPMFLNFSRLITFTYHNAHEFFKDPQGHENTRVKCLKAGGENRGFCILFCSCTSASPDTFLPKTMHAGSGIPELPILIRKYGKGLTIAKGQIPFHRCRIARKRPCWPLVGQRAAERANLASAKARPTGQLAVLVTRRAGRRIHSPSGRVKWLNRAENTGFGLPIEPNVYILCRFDFDWRVDVLRIT